MFSSTIFGGILIIKISGGWGSLVRRCLYWPPSPLDWGLVMVAGLVGTSSWSHLNWDVCKKLELVQVCCMFIVLVFLCSTAS